MASTLAQEPGNQPQTPAPIPQDAPRVAQLKKDAAADVDAMRVFTQQMVDSVFSFGELGFQEFETNRYLIDILRQNGFSVEEGVAGIPTAFIATWGSGKPVLALGSDIDAAREFAHLEFYIWNEGGLVGEVLLAPVLALTNGTRGAVAGGAIALPMLAKRVMGNARPAEPGLPAYWHRLLYDRDPEPRAP